MDQLARALREAVALCAGAITAGFASAAEEQDAAREKLKDASEGAALQALLGPAVEKVASELISELGRATQLRYAAYLRHPRLGREALVAEADAADVAFSESLVRLQRSPGPQNAFLFTVAGIRVTAITEVVGPACIASEAPRTKRRGGAHQRRREVGPADIPSEVAAVLVSARSGTPIESVIQQLRQLETTAANRNAIVTKLVALAARDGIEFVRQLADRLIAAGYSTRAALPPPSPDKRLDGSMSPEGDDLAEVRVTPPSGYTAQLGRRALAPSSPDGDGTIAMRAKAAKQRAKSFSERLAEKQRPRRPDRTGIV